MRIVFKYIFSFLFFSIAAVFLYLIIMEKIHDIRVVNKSENTIVLKGVAIDGYKVSSRKISVEPIDGKSYGFAFYYTRTMFPKGSVLTLFFQGDHGEEIKEWSCLRKDNVDGRCVFTLVYDGKSGGGECSCDSLNDFE